MEMLIGQHRCRHQHSHLFRVAGCLERCSHSNLRLAKTHVATDQSVHGSGLLHIGLHVVRGLQLVGGVLIQESCLQFVLQEGVWREGKTLLFPAGGIQLNQVAGNILQFLLGALLHALPLACTQMRKAWRIATILRLILRHLIQRMNGHIDGSATVVLYLDHLLIAVTLRHAHQSAKASDAMIDVNHIVTRLKLLDFLQRQCHLTATGLVRTKVIFMETVENLVVSKYAEFAVRIHKTSMEGLLDGLEGNSGNRTSAHRFHLCEDILQSLQLFAAVCQNIELIAVSQILLQRLLQQFEILVELGLGRNMEGERGIRGKRWMVAHLHTSETLNVTTELRTTDQLHLALHLHPDFLFLHLGGTLKALCQSLLRETFLIGSFHDVLYILEVLSHQQHII